MEKFVQDYSGILSMFGLRPRRFIDNVIRTGWGYVVFHFVVILLLLYLPVFLSMARTPAHEMYRRMYGGFSSEEESSGVRWEELLIGIAQDESGGVRAVIDGDGGLWEVDSMKGVFVRHELDEDALNALDENTAWFCFSDDLVAYADGVVKLAAPWDAFDADLLTRLDYEGLFDVLAYYNGYQLYLLLPSLGLIFLLLLLLELIFYLVVGYFLGMTRLIYQPISFDSRVKVTVFSSTYTALLCFAVGLVLPVMHIIIFQALTLFFTIFIFKQYDMPETRDL